MNNGAKISLACVIVCIICEICSYLMYESYVGQSFVLSHLMFWFNMMAIFFIGIIVFVITTIYFVKKGK